MGATYEEGVLYILVVRALGGAATRKKDYMGITVINESFRSTNE